MNELDQRRSQKIINYPQHLQYVKVWSTKVTKSGKSIRRIRIGFIDFHSNDEPRKAVCRICEETTGRLNRLVPRYVNNILDDKFKVCSYCGELYATYDVKFVSEYEPKARLNENPFESGTQVSMINKRRVKEIKNRIKPKYIYNTLQLLT